MKKEIILPYAPILVESTRSIGYSFESALADIIDNSISKNAKMTALKQAVEKARKYIFVLILQHHNMLL